MSASSHLHAQNVAKRLNTSVSRENKEELYKNLKRQERLESKSPNMTCLKPELQENSINKAFYPKLLTIIRVHTSKYIIIKQIGCNTQ